MTTRTLATAADLLAPAEAKNLLSDGTLWSHAATLGTRVKGTQFTIDADTVGSFVSNFRGGYPSKAPVDYDHGSTSGAADGRMPVPKAGDVVEMAAVLSAADLNDSMRQQVQAAGRKLDDPRNLGLWVRWRPTRRALAMILEREYSEMSIAFDSDYPNNTTGEGQGPTILAVALTNTPFLDDMIPVAASRSDGGQPPVAGNEERQMSKPTILARLSAALGRALPSDDEAADVAAERITELQRDVAELSALRTNMKALTAEIGETDPVKALAAVKQLKADAQAAKDATKAAQEAALSAQVDGILAKYEDKITPAQKPFYAKNLKADFAAGQKAGETDTEKALTAAKPHGITAPRASAADDGSNPDYEQKLDARTKELQRDEKLEYAVALQRAERELKHLRTA